MLWLALILNVQLTFAATEIDVNDVSYLWPPPLTKEEARELPGAADFVPPKVFEQIVDFASGGELQRHKVSEPILFPAPATNIQNWKIASVRIDPCAPGPEAVADLNQCLQEIRLVAQPVSVNSWGLEYFDFALHILIEVGQGHPASSPAFSKLLRELLQLKIELSKTGIETSGLALTIHPGFQSEKFREGWKQVILKSAQAARLKKITFSGSVTGRGPWLFFQGLVENGEYPPEPDVNLRGQPHGSLAPMAPGLGGTFNPAPSNSGWSAVTSETYGPSIADLFYSGKIDLNVFAQLGDGRTSSTIRKRDIVPLLDNPRFSNRTNTDCFSCHTSTSRALQLELDTASSPFRFQPPAGVTSQALWLDKSIMNLRAFGWFGSKPAVSQRVVNESAAVAAYLGGLVLD